jgi:hypothetical protein
MRRPQGFNQEKTAMRFFSIIRAAEQQGRPPQSLMDAMDKYVARTLAEGSVVSTGGLAPSAGGWRIRMQGGKLTITDGPFAESKEVVGGYAVIEARTREEAIRATREFMQLHVDHWPEWVGECEVRELAFLAP